MSEQPTLFPEFDQVEFRSIPDFPGYCVGSDGTVWSCYGRKQAWHKLKPQKKRRKKSPVTATCLQIQLHRVGVAKPFTRAVHRLILESFVGPCPSGMQCCHNDGNASNNRLPNLRWDTPKSNAADRIRHGTNRLSYGYGEGRAAAVLTDDKVREIYLLKRNGFGNGRIAKMFGVTKPAIRSIFAGKTWRHVKDDTAT